MTTDRVAVVEIATSSADTLTARLVAARIGVLDRAGSVTARWEWGSARADEMAGEITQTLRALLAVGVPLATYDAATHLTVLDRECRRRGVDPLTAPAPVLDVLLLDHLLLPGSAPSRTLAALAERYGVTSGSFVAGRLVLALLDAGLFLDDPADLHSRQRGLLAGWPVVPVDDVSYLEDTRPHPGPPPRRSAATEALEAEAAALFALGEVAPPAEVPGAPLVEPGPATLLPEPSAVATPPVEAVEPAPTTIVTETPVVAKPRTPRGPQRIHVAAAIVTDASGRAVVVRKRGTTGYMQPGGKIERGESALAALGRELREELGIEIDVDATEFLGSFEAPALNEPGRTVRAEVFALQTDHALAPSGEIDSLHWLESPDDVQSVELAPLTVDVLLPLWAARRLSRS